MANTLTALTPTIWSRKGVALLREKIVMPNLVRVDFSTDVAQFGDTVNTRKPAELSANNVNTITGVTVQNVSATNIPVTLDQHKDATFQISDREAGRSFVNLVDMFLDPAMLAIANQLDSDLLGLYTDISTEVTYTSAGAWQSLVNSARTKLNKNKCPDGPRRLVLSNDDEGQLTNLALLVQANTSGSQETLRNGGVGRFKGFDVYRASNVVSVGSPAVRKNLAFHPNAFALVTRVPATAAGVTPGALQSVGMDPDAGLAIRTTISYNATLLATQITVDIIYGMATLDEYLACVVNGEG